MIWAITLLINIYFTYVLHLHSNLIGPEAECEAVKRNSKNLHDDEALLQDECPQIPPVPAQE